MHDDDKADLPEAGLGLLCVVIICLFEVYVKIQRVRVAYRNLSGELKKYKGQSEKDKQKVEMKGI